MAHELKAWNRQFKMSNPVLETPDAAFGCQVPPPEESFAIFLGSEHRLAVAAAEATGMHALAPSSSGRSVISLSCCLAPQLSCWILLSSCGCTPSALLLCVVPLPIVLTASMACLVCSSIYCAGALWSGGLVVYAWWSGVLVVWWSGGLWSGGLVPGVLQHLQSVLS